MPNINEDNLDSPEAWAAATQRSLTEDTATRVGINLSNAATVNPDQAATDQRIAKALGVPPESVAAYPEMAKQRAINVQHDPAQIAQDTPVLANMLTDQHTANVVHDDLHNLANIEQVGNDPEVNAYQKMLDTKGYNPLASGLYQVIGGANAQAAKVLKLGTVPLMATATALDAAFGTNTRESVAKYLSDPLDQDIAVGTAKPDASFTDKAANQVGGLASMIMESMITAPTTIANTAGTLWATIENTISHGAGAMAVPALASAVDTGQKVFEQTGDGVAAFHAAKADYISNEVTPMIPFSAPGKLLSRMAGGAAAGVASGDLARRYMNANMPEGMQSPASFEDSVLSALMGAGFGAAGGHHVGAGWNDAVRKTYTDHAAAEASQQDFQRLNILSHLSDAAAYRERDPEGFKNFVNDVTEDGRLKDVYIDANVLMQAIDKSGTNAQEFKELMPEVAAQINEAKETSPGSMVKIPTGDYATHIAGTDLDKAILPELKTDPEGMTYTEMQDHYATETERMKGMASDLNDKHNADAQWRQSEQNAHDAILQNLKDNGRFPDHIAKTQAAMKSLVNSAMARRLGITPEENYKLNGDYVTGGKLGEGFEQSAIPHPELLNRDIKSEDGYNFESGKPVTFAYIHNKESATKLFGKPNKDSPFDRGYEPSGKYINSIAEKRLGAEDFGKLETGKVTFQNPLVLKGENWKKEISAAYGGLTGKKLSQAIIASGHDGVVTTGTHGVSEILDLTSFDKSKALYQKAEDVKDLLIQHNLSEGNLLHADKMGGLPVPSLAVTKAKHPLTGFGGITLLGDEAMADPKGYANTKVYGADIYSPRYPKVTHLVKSSETNRLNKELEPFRNLAGGTEIRPDDIASEGKRALEDSNAVMAQFLKSKGVEPEVVGTKSPIDEGRRAHLIEQGFEKYLGNKDRYTLEGDKDFQKLVIDATNADYAREGMSDLAIKPDTKKADYTVRNYAREIADDASHLDGPDRYETQTALRRQIESLGLVDQFNEHVDNTLNSLNADEKIFKGWSNQGNKTWTPHTLDNVIKLLKKELRGGEGHNYGVGSIRSKFTPEFRSIASIRANKGRLLDGEGFADVKGEIDNEFEDLANSLRDNHTIGNDFGFLDTLSSTLYDAATMGLPRALKENGFTDVSQEQMREAADFLNKLRNLPAEYFEAKILRAVDLSEFKGAVVPEGTSQRALDVLQKKGITHIVKYKNNDDADRAAKIQQFQHLFFQESRGFYSPEHRMIALLKDADLSTYIHETGHYLVDVYSKIAASADAPLEIKNDVDLLLKHVGVEGATPEERLANWHDKTVDEQRPYHEQLAQAFEQYMMEGKAPTPELHPVFARIKAWMGQVYKSLQALGVPISPEVRGVFDRMFASEDEIYRAEQTRGYWSEIGVKPAGVSDEKWNEYLQLGKDATQTGIDEMQAKSIRDMRWSSNLKLRAMKGLAKDAAGLRREARIDARRDIMTQPVYQAWSFLTRKDEQAYTGEQKEKASKELDTSRDSMLVAIAKLGGMSRDAVKSEWGVQHGDVTNEVVGKPVLRKEGGLSVDAMAERLGEEGYLSKDEHGKVDLHEFEEKFSQEMGGDKQYSDHADYDRIVGHDLTKEDAAEYPAGKLNYTQVVMIAGREAADRLASFHMTSKGGFDPDVLCDKFGFNSGEGLLKALNEAEPPHSAIEGLTDRYMLERHGELATPDAIERTAEAAIHNDVRARFIATGLKIFSDSPIPARQIEKGAKEAAEGAIAQKKVGDINPRQYTAQERKANKEAIKLAASDPKGSIMAQRSALLNNQLAKASMDAQKEIATILKYVKRFDKASIRDKIPGTFLEQIDGLLNQFDFRQVPTVSNKPKEALLKWADGLRELGYEPQIAEWLTALDRGVHYKELTMEKFRGVYDTVRSIEATAKETRYATIAGERVLVDSIVKEMRDKMDETGEKFTKEELINPPETKTDGVWKTLLYKLGVRLRAADADLVPTEFKFNKYDAHEIGGIFHKAILDPMFKANYDKVDMLRTHSNEMKKVGDMLGKDWQDHLYDLVNNDTLIDPRLAEEGQPTPMMKITRAKLLGIMRHLGNESNFEKLCSGYGWHPADVWAFVHKNATEKDWQATQAHWDSFEPLWVKTEAMLRRLGGVPPPKIPAREFEVVVRDAEGHPKTLEMRGGYSPIDYDPVSSKLSQRKGEFDLQPGDKVAGESMLYRATTTSNGSLIARSQGYSDYVNLNIHSADARIRDTIHDLAYREVLLDATKIINHGGFRGKFMRVYGAEEYQALTAWLKGIRDMNMIDPKNRMFDNAMQYTKQGVVMTGIAYRLSTFIKHGSSAALKSLGYLGNAAGASHFASHVAAMASGHLKEEIAGAQEKFSEIRTRMLQMDRDYKVGERSMYEGEDWRAKNERFGHAMVAWSDAISAIPTAWAAYDLARTTGVPESMGGTGKPMSESEAVDYANRIVRQAHGTALESARSNFMQAGGVKGLFGTIYGFMNNSYGQTRDMYSKAFSGGQFNNNPALVARALTAIVVPGMLAEWVSSGGPGSEESGWVWSLKAAALEMAGMIPFVRDAAGMINYSHSADMVAPIRAVNDVVLTGYDLVKESEGKHSKLIQDLSNAVGEWAHIGGLGQLGKTLQYLHDVHDGHTPEPANMGAAVHDAALGYKKPKE